MSIIITKKFLVLFGLTNDVNLKRSAEIGVTVNILMSSFCEILMKMTFLCEVF